MPLKYRLIMIELDKKRGWRATLSLFKQETRMRQKGYDDQINIIQNEILGNTGIKGSTPEKKPAEAGVAPVSAGMEPTDITQESVDMLKKDPTPKNKAFFDKTYGAGYADFILKG